MGASWRDWRCLDDDTAGRGGQFWWLGRERRNEQKNSRKGRNGHAKVAKEGKQQQKLILEL